MPSDKNSQLRFLTAFGGYTAEPSNILGQGGAGTVYRAESDDHAVVAIKVLDPSKATKEKVRRFKNEILFGEYARHPRVLRVLGSGSVNIRGADASFYVMPFYAATLRNLIDAGISPDRVLPLFATLLDGVEAAHLQGVVHRDLKPENVLYDAEDDALVVGDFGIAHFEDDARFTIIETQPHSRLANFQYAAPEQRQRGGTVDRRADIYALGLMLNEMFTQIVPHGTSYRVVHEVAPAYSFVDELISSMIRQDPAGRPSGVDAVKQILLRSQHEYVRRQKLDELHNRVVPSSTVVDPLIDDPIRIIDMDIVSQDTVILILNHPPTQKWVEIAEHVHGYSYPMGQDPKRMPRSGNRVTVSGPRDLLQSAIDAYKSFLTAVAKRYPLALAEEAARQERDEQRRRAAAAEAERRRVELKQLLTF